MLESLALVAFLCPAWLLATGADGRRFPVVLCHICHFCADVLGTPRRPKWHQTPTFRQVKRAARKCPPWQSVGHRCAQGKEQSHLGWGFNGAPSRILLVVLEEGRWQRSDGKVYWGEGKGQM